LNIFQQLFQLAEFYITVRSTQLWSMAIFEHKHFTRCETYGGTFSYFFAENSLISLLVKEFSKPFSIWQS